MALEVYSQADATSDAYARILVLGAPKIGKTTCIVKSAPKPLIINCDGASATKGAANLGATFSAVNVGSIRSWQEACALAIKGAAEGTYSTVIVDTVTLLADTLEKELRAKGLAGWDLAGALNDALAEGVDLLRNKLAAHLFFVAHITPDHEGVAGTLPDIYGRMKKRLPQAVDDWILLDVEPGRKPHERVFLLGPQKAWTHSGRNVKRTCQVEADVVPLFEELGIPL